MKNTKQHNPKFTFSNSFFSISSLIPLYPNSGSGSIKLQNKKSFISNTIFVLSVFIINIENGKMIETSSGK
jgi:hypothetical protein